MYDIIGDVHGYATPLRKLLEKMDYVEEDGVWKHHERKVIFLGDFIDRGPEQLASVQIARSMVEAGHALAVMGNHEFNAIAWATPNLEMPGTYLRPHNKKNLNQHSAFLQQVGENTLQHQDMIAWFKTLPLYLDLDGLRVIHACWHPHSLRILSRFTDDENRLLSDALPVLSKKGTEPYDALETVLKGLEIQLPTGYSFNDKDGNARHHIRTRWWELETLTYRDLAVVPPEVIEQIPHDPVPADILPGYDGEKPLFVGHYWLTGQPAPLNKYVACLDYSIAAQNTKTSQSRGKLCAYRWQGETELSNAHFIWVS